MKKGCMSGWMERWTEGWMEGWVEGRVEGWMEGWMSEEKEKRKPLQDKDLGCESGSDAVLLHQTCATFLSFLC